MHNPATIIHADFGTSLIETRGLTYKSDGRRFVDDVTLRIKSERRTVILGPNGAGKSLLLRLMHGMISPTGGEVIWQGRSLDANARASQAMVFQRPVMLRRTVLGNLMFALRAKNIARSERKMLAATLLDHAGLGDMAHRPARLLSGGEQQKLAIVRAMIGSPRILFLDEPTASLDPAATRAIEDLILDVQRQGTTVVMVTHDLGQARRLADDVVFLHGGRMVESGTANRVLQTPQHSATQAWIEGRLYLD